MLVTLIRHPRPLVAAGLCYGRLDLPVHPDAAAQIRQAAAIVPQQPVWSSPALRCRGMAQALSAAPRWDDRLLELDFGDWEGRPWDTISRDSLDRWAADPWGFSAPSGETGASLVARVRAFHAMLRETGADCTVISHGGPLKILQALLQAHPINLLAPPPPIGSITTLAQAG